MSRAREWAFRCELEFDHPQPGVSWETCWTTLTYDDEHLPVTLRKKHLSGFLRRLRKAMGAQRVRFFASGEYGERKGRPHYHAILFGMSDSPAIQASWRYGLVKTFPLSKALIAYTAGYCAKKAGHREMREERIDYSTGEVYTYQPPFLLMSRKPGLGAAARDRFTSSWRDHAIYSGNPIPVPRFLHDRWAANATSSQLSQLNQEKLSARRPLVRDRLKASEAINNARLTLKAERRTL